MIRTLARIHLEVDAKRMAESAGKGPSPLTHRGGREMSDGRKTVFWCASIAGADCEPVEVASQGGERIAYTCGCGDSFWIDRADSLVLLVEEMERPMTPKQEKRAWINQQRRIRYDVAHQHHWRGPR